MRNFLFLAILVLMGAGCAENMPRAEALPQVLLQGTEIVSAVVKGDFKRFAKAADEAAELPEKEEAEFRKSCAGLTEKFGQLESFRYMGELKTPLLVNQIYALRFKRKQSNGSWIEHDQLFQLIFGKTEDQYKLLGMRFL